MTLTLTHRVRLAALLSRHGWRSVRRRFGAPLRLLAVAASRTPERLLIAPQDIRTPDPQIAVDIYSGYFAFGGKAAEANGYSPFLIEPPSPGWTRILMGFGWLRHLRAADTTLARANARTLVQDWINIIDRPRMRSDAETAFEPRVVARRILSWLSQSPIILEGADHAFYQAFTASLGRQAVYLQRRIAEGLGGETLLLASVALAELGLCVEGLSKLHRKASRLLAGELARQILPDGGHISRNPRALIELLLDLLPLRQAYAARGVQPPAQLLNAIDRMMPMLRMFRHGDGTLALFNGMGVTAPELLATVLAYDDARAGAMFNAPHSGYQRLQAGEAVVVMDTGKPPPLAFSGEAHASCLAFEFSSGDHRLIVNCGAPDPGRQAAYEAARATAAHSALTVADTSSCRFAAQRGAGDWSRGEIIGGPRKVAVERGESATAFTLTASHDGYLPRFGLLHSRTLSLSADGTRLSGEDGLTLTGRKGRGAPDYAARFHLHPTVKASATQQGRAVMLASGPHEAWVFEAGGLQITLEDSIFYAAPDGPRRATQIVVNANCADSSVLQWSLTRVAQGEGRQTRQRESPQRLF